MKTRPELLKAARNSASFDIIVIGGGATGAGVAVDAASRGLKVLLLEQHDFGKGTSSRSTKLIHGGLRYLKQGNIKLVQEALQERGRLVKNAPHLVGHLSFLIPLYHYYEGPFYGAGLKLYDALAGSLGLKPSKFLSKEEVLKKLPNVKQEGLKGGLLYYDGQFDDSRLLISLIHTASDLGAICLNYTKVIDFIKEDGRVAGVIAQDFCSDEQLRFEAKSVICAAGVFSDNVRGLSDESREPFIRPSQGIHLVIPKDFFQDHTALMIPKTEDGRVLFIVPWQNRLLLGTTDTEKEHIELEPIPLESEISFILEEAGKYLTTPPKREDVLSVFAGLRPLIAQKGKLSKSLSRDHVIEISPSALITIVGGKWTTYRKMAEDAVDCFFKLHNMEKIPSQTHHLKLHGYKEGVDPALDFSKYGSDDKLVLEIEEQMPFHQEQIHPKLPFSVAEVIFSCRFELAIKIEDFLARRSRALLIDAQSAIEAAPLVAQIMAKELGYDSNWVEKEIANFRKLAEIYSLNSPKRE